MIDVVIKAHPKRRDAAEALASRLACRIQWDPEPDNRLTWPVIKAAWTYGSAATHRLVVEDDIVPCRDFLVAVQRIARLYPDRVVSFYTARETHLQRALCHRWTIVAAARWRNTQAVLMPVTTAQAWVRWVDAKAPDGQWPGERQIWGDVVLADYLKDRGMPMWVTIPSLVEHGSPGDSLLGHPNRMRTAAWFVGEHRSALDYDWTRAEAAQNRAAPMGAGSRAEA